MTDIERTKWLLCGKAIDLAADVKRMEENADRIQKVNIYLMRRYYDELAQEFGEAEVSFPDVNLDDVSKTKKELLEQLRFATVFDRIAKKMNEEMPDPYYYYGFSGKSKSADSD